MVFEANSALNFLCLKKPGKNDSADASFHKCWIIVFRKCSSVSFEMGKNQEIVVLGQNEADNGVDQTEPEDFKFSTTGVA